MKREQWSCVCWACVCDFRPFSRCFLSVSAHGCCAVLFLFVSICARGERPARSSTFSKNNGLFTLLCDSHGLNRREKSARQHGHHRAESIHTGPNGAQRCTCRATWDSMPCEHFVYAPWKISFRLGCFRGELMRQFLLYVEYIGAALKRLSLCHWCCSTATISLLLMLV